jgi:hypothetical protein
LAAVPAVNTEIGIGRKQDRIRVRLGHPNEAGVSETHRDIDIFLHESQHWLLVPAQLERDAQIGSAKKCDK